MKFLEIFRFEFSYQIKQPATWLFFIIIAALAYLNTGDESVADALYEDLFLNSPFAVAKTTVIGTLIWLVTSAAVAGSAAARDIATRIHPLTYTTPVSRIDYIGGRFLAAFTINAILLTAVQLGIVIGIFSPGVDPQAIGPYGIAPFVSSYLVISLPNAFFATALQFFLASSSGRPTRSYFGSFFLFFMGFFVGAVVLYYKSFGSLVDPIGIRYIIEDLAHNWTPTERQSRTLSFEGSILWNRLLWLSVGALALSITYLRFQFNDRTRKASWWRRKKRRTSVEQTTDSPTYEGKPVFVPHIHRTFSFSTQMRQTFAMAWGSFRSIWSGPVGLALLIGIPLLTIIVVYNKIPAGGVPRIPTTSLVVGELTAPIAAALSPWAIIPFLLVIFAGEMVWHERDARLSDIIDTAPTREWSLLLSKFIGVALVIAAFMTLIGLGGICTQLMMGYSKFEIGLYLKVLFGLQLPEYLLFALIVVIVHVLVNKKYIAHLVSIIVSVFIVMPMLFGIEHKLLVYNAGPQWSHSEMRGFGASLAPWAWFKMYWATWAVLLAVLASLFWVRGKDEDLRSRLAIARMRFTRPVKLTAALAGTVTVIIGSFIFYNTNVLNVYLTDNEYTEVRAEYERRYSHFKHLAQPSVAATRLQVDIYPKRGAADIKGEYHLVNRTTSPIDTIHVAIIPGASNSPVEFDREVAAVSLDDEHGARIYSLKDPLQPGDSLKMTFEVNVARYGFGNGGVHESVVDNGTFFTNQDWLPAIGYRSQREIMSATDRREHGLQQKRLIPSLYDSAARMASPDRGTLEVVMSTDEDQVAVTSGALRKTWTENGRKYFSYATDGPISGDYVFFSAKYQMKVAQWQADSSSKPVDIRIYYHPTHDTLIDRMVHSVRASFTNYTKNFGAYPHDHITMIEVRGNEIGMHADESIVRFSEGTALWNPSGFDLPFSVVAHEVSHQWWGHKLQAAFVEGAPVLSESMAVYCSMRVMEETFGPEQLQQHLAFMRQPFPYAPIRHGEPILRGIDPYISYRKAPFALYNLAEHIGADKVNAALAGLMESHPQGHLPLATTLDLYKELNEVTPDSSRYLLHELFEVNTFWQFKIERVTAQQNQDSTWHVDLEITSNKIVADEAGAETEAPLNEWIEVGVFGNGGAGRPRLSQQLYFKKHLINSKQQTISITVAKKPGLAGIDPYHVFDWEEREDDENIRRVRTEL